MATLLTRQCDKEIGFTDCSPGDTKTPSDTEDQNGDIKSTCQNIRNSIFKNLVEIDKKENLKFVNSGDKLNHLTTSTLISTSGDAGIYGNRKFEKDDICKKEGDQLFKALDENDETKFLLETVTDAEKKNDLIKKEMELAQERAHINFSIEQKNIVLNGLKSYFTTNTEMSIYRIDCNPDDIGEDICNTIENYDCKKSTKDETIECLEQKLNEDVSTSDENTIKEKLIKKLQSILITESIIGEHDLFGSDYDSLPTCINNSDSDYDQEQNHNKLDQVINSNALSN